MCKGKVRQSKDTQRELDFRAHGQRDTDFDCPQISQNSQIYCIYNKHMAF